MHAYNVLKFIGEKAYFSPYLKYFANCEYFFSNESGRNFRTEAISIAKDTPAERDNIIAEMKAIMTLLKWEKDTYARKCGYKCKRTPDDIRVRGIDDNNVVQVFDVTGQHLDSYKNKDGQKYTSLKIALHDIEVMNAI